jgi:cell division protein FtsW
LIYGTKLNHGSRWVSLPVVNITFQSSDFAKLALFVYLAKVLSLKQEVIKDFYKGFIPVVFPVIVICVLILPANLSTALMLGFTCCILFYIGRVNVKHILILAVSGIALIGLMILFNIGPRAATWKNRILTYVSAEKKVAASDDDKEDEFQATQAKIAIANGGLNGLGPGKSMQRNFLPHPYSDFIYAIIIEEYGLLGGAVLMFIYMLFLWRCIRIFQRCPYAYGAFLAVGLSITLVFQAMLNMGVNTSLLPVTGLTLPMVSMGGSSIWFTSIAIGIILSVSSNVGETEGTEHKISELNKATN